MDYTNEINQALKNFKLGKKQLAFDNLKKIFNKNKNNDQLRFNLAVVAQSLNLNEEAKKYYKYLIRNTHNYKAMINLYLLYISESNFIDALKIIDNLINKNIEISKINKDKAFVLHKLKKYDESISICKKALRITKDISYLNILGLNYFAKDRFFEAEKIFKEALNIDNNNSSILNSLGRIYHEVRDSKNAEAYLLKAYKLNSNSYEIINNLAGFYREESQYKKSIDLYLKALDMNPSNSTIINNLAKAYFDTNQLKLSEMYCLKALSLNKHDGNIQKILSLIYLRQQKYEMAWLYFDGRLNLSDFSEKNSSINNIREKILRDKNLTKNLKILVIREQGIGDEILYGTMYGDLLNSYKNVTIECDKRLKNIFSNSFQNYKNCFVNFGQISLNKSLLKNYNAILYAGSLGKFFRNQLSDFKSGCYLLPNEKLISKYKKKLKSYSGEFNIGISWKSFKNRYANEKSLILNDFNELTDIKNCNFINLQYGEVNKEVNDYNKKYKRKLITIDDLDLYNEFDKLAAVLRNLDLFITVSNSTAHLAGALGVKTLLIRPQNHAVFHYWNQPKNKTPWYNTITFLDDLKHLNKNNLLKKYLSK